MSRSFSAVTSSQSDTQPPVLHLVILALTSLTVSRQWDRPPLEGLARIHLANMKNFNQTPSSRGSVQMAWVASLTRPAHASLAPFGTWRRVEIRRPKMSWRVGRDRVGGDESSSATAGKTASELEGGRQDVAGPGQGREEEAGAGARHAGGGAATGAGMRAEARFSHRPSRPGRQAEQGRPCFTQEQFLHLPERLQRQQAMVGDIWNVRRQ